MNQEEIKTILPHRDNMLLVEEVVQEGDEAIGTYHVRGDEWFLKGHFPDNPVVPGVILCEMLAQSACILLRDQMTEGKLTMYTGLDKVKFKAPVRPGDTIELTCRITKSRGPVRFATGEARVNGELCCQAEMSFALMPA